MKPTKILLCSAVLLAALGVARVASAAVTAEVAIEESGVKLLASVRLHGIAAGESFKTRFEWTAPEGARLTGPDGVAASSTLAWFSGSMYTPEKPAGVAGVPWRVFCKDSRERGCWRTRAERTIEYTYSKRGKNGGDVAVRGVGAWKLVVRREDTGEELGSGVREVK